MNKLILFSLVSVFTNVALSASAQAEAVIAEIKFVSQNIASVQLTDKGVLQIIGGNNMKTDVKLSESNAANLISTAQLLGSAEIVTTHQDFVCMMMPLLFSEQNLLVADTKSGILKMVLSSSACFIADHTAPKDPFYSARAEELKAQMIALAQQSAND